MAATKVYGIYGVTIATAAPLGGVINCGVPLGTITEEVVTDGNVNARFQSVMSQSPIPTFTTHAIAEALSLCGVEGTDISGLSGGLSLYAQSRADGSTREGATSHVQYAIATGIVIPTSLSVSQDGSATLTYVATAISASGNAPLVITDSVTLPATTDTERFGIGDCTLGGVAVTGVTGYDIDFGINVNAVMADGETFPSFSSIDFVQPTITIRTLDASLGASGGITFDGLNGTHANTIFYLRKRAQGGRYVSDVTEEHIKFTTYGRIDMDDAFQGGDTSQGEMSIIIKPIEDGSGNTPIQVDTVSAIT